MTITETHFAKRCPMCPTPSECAGKACPEGRTQQFVPRSAAPEPVPALCPECGRDGFRTNANGVQECGSMACINFPYFTSLNRAKWEALRAVSSPRAHESQSPEPLVAESVTKGSPAVPVRVDGKTLAEAMLEIDTLARNVVEYPNLQPELIAKIEAFDARCQSTVNALWNRSDSASTVSSETPPPEPENPTEQHWNRCPKLFGGECNCNPTPLRDAAILESWSSEGPRDASPPTDSEGGFSPVQEFTSAEAYVPRDASAPIDELKASKATPRQLREARVTGILAKVDNQVSRGMVAPHLDGADVLALASALREAREQLAQARSELDEEIRRSAAWAQEREDRHAAQWEQARRAVEQLKPDDIRLLHQFIEYSQTDYFYPEKNYPEWRDRVKAEGDSLVARIKGILSSPPQQSVSPESAKGA